MTDPTDITSDTIDVLIVGGGPVGLTMACELLRHGVRCRIVEQLDAPVTYSKAAAVQARTLEVLEDMGIVQALIERGRKMYGMNLYTGAKRVAHVDIQVPGSSYGYILGVEQTQTEAVLTEHLEHLGGRLERQVTLSAFEQDEDGVDITLVHGPDEREERVRASWLIGCDGARSTVRHILELPFEGSTFEQSLIQGDIRVEFPFQVPPGEAVLILSEHGPLGFLPLLSEGRYRMIIMAPDEAHAEPTLENFQALAEQRGPEGLRVSDPAWLVGFRFHGRIVPHYRVERVFLAGDAAHIHSPAGAQGMNMGMQDAYNLAWKLALVVNDQARPALLDSYDPERRPVGQSTVQTTDRGTRAAMRFLTLRSPIAQLLRNQAMSLLLSIGALQDRAFRSLGGLLVNYRESPAVDEYRSSIWTARLGSAKSHESPTLVGWYSFGDGPGPGERVPDMDLDLVATDADGEDLPATLFGLLQGTKHNLLLFDGAARTHAGYRNLSTIAAAVADRYGHLISIHLVALAESRPEDLDWKGSTLLDHTGEMHQHFGAGSECLYLIRPDGHVGFRSQPAVSDKLTSYLDSLFIPR